MVVFVAVAIAAAAASNGGQDYSNSDDDDDDDDDDDFSSAIKTIECAKAYEFKCRVSADLKRKLNAIRKRFIDEGNCPGKYGFYPNGRAYYTHKQRCQCCQSATGSKQTVKLVPRSGSLMRSLRQSLSNYSRSHTNTHIIYIYIY